MSDVVGVREAVETIHGMFDGAYSKQVIKSLLQANGGVMEAAIEQLLSGGGDAGGAGGGGEEASAADTSHDEEVARQLARELNGASFDNSRPAGASSSSGRPGAYDPQPPPRPQPRASQRQTSAKHGKGRGYHTELPKDFLRVPRGSEQHRQQLLADERLAMMLQNQDFLDQHPEFARSSSTSQSGQSQRQQAAGAEADEKGITEHLQEMGEDMKRKLNELAIKWNLKPPGRAETNTAYSTVPLMGDDDDAEVVNLQHDTATAPTRRPRGLSGSSHSAAAAAGAGTGRKKDN